MALDNIEKFDRTVGLIFAELYRRFPQRADLTMKDVCAPRYEEFDPNAADEYWEDERFFKDTMEWLIQSGYVWCRRPGNVPSNAFFECCLSVKGLESLKAIPDALSGKSLGSQLQDAAQSGLLDTVKSLSGKALSVGASMGYSALSTWTSS